MVEIKEVLRLWAMGHGYRTVSSRTGVDRKTVRRYVETAKRHGLRVNEADKAIDDQLIADVVLDIRPGAGSAAGAMRGHCRAHSQLLAGWLAEGCRGPKLVKLLARHTGVVVPLRTLQRFVKEELREPRADTVRIVDGAPGILEVDFLQLGEFRDLSTGQPTMLHALLMTAPYSRHQFLWPCLSQTQEDVFDGLEAAWDFFGGVFPILLPDNLKAIVTKASPDPIFNREFVEYAQARGFDIDPARARKPKDKARVERQVRFVRDDYFRGERFGSVGEARIAARRWCLKDAGTRTHGRTRRQPLMVFEAEEKPCLKPAPSEPYDQPRWGDFSVGRDHAVVVDYALYSVPFGLGECRLRVRCDRATVKFYLRGRLVKMHPRQPRGGTRIDAVDLPPGKAELATRDATSLCSQADAMGPHLGEYARQLAAGPLPWSRMRHVYRLLGMARRFGEAATDEACARALEVGVVDVSRIDGMLKNGLVSRRLIKPNQTPPRGQVLRFARSSSEFSVHQGGDDVSA